MSESTPIKHPTWLTTGDFTEADEPLRLFAAWFEEATEREPGLPEAMALATVDADGLPNVRMVLMKGFDERGFVFYTNIDSAKGPRTGRRPARRALLFHWKSLNRQVRLRGPVERVDGRRGRRLFRHPATPGPDRRLGEQAIGAARKPPGLRKGDRALPRRNSHSARCHGRRTGSGYRLLPLRMEFWHDRPYRLHDRIEFRRDTAWRSRGARRGSIRELACVQLGSAYMPTSHSNQPRRTLLLTGASRGIGHATVKRFSAAGWRVITCSRHPFPENCPWEMGPEDHIQVDLADPGEHARGDRRDQAAARERRAACAGQQRRDLAQGRGRQAARPRSTPRSTSGSTCSG